MPPPPVTDGFALDHLIAQRHSSTHGDASAPPAMLCPSLADGFESHQRLNSIVDSAAIS
jgi:hypothetical protein